MKRAYIAACRPDPWLPAARTRRVVARRSDKPQGLSPVRAHPSRPGPGGHHRSCGTAAGTRRSASWRSAGACWREGGVQHRPVVHGEVGARGPAAPRFPRTDIWASVAADVALQRVDEGLPAGLAPALVGSRACSRCGSPPRRGRGRHRAGPAWRPAAGSVQAPAGNQQLGLLRVVQAYGKTRRRRTASARSTRSPAHAARGAPAATSRLIERSDHARGLVFVMDHVECKVAHGDRFEAGCRRRLACAVAGLFILRKIKNDAGFAAVISTEVPPPPGR